MVSKWRERYAKIMDTNPNEILTNSKMIRLCNSASKIKTPEDIIEILGVMDNTGKKQLPKVMLGQEWTLFRLMTECETFMSKLDSTVCHNCLKVGHIAVHCPFPKNKHRVREYFEQQPEKRKARNRKNYEKWLKRKNMKSTNN